MKSRQKLQYTIRNIPPAIDRALRQNATRTRRSLNEVALEALAKSANVEGEMRKHRDLDQFFGSWIQDDAIEIALSEQRVVDRKLWK